MREGVCSRGGDCVYDHPKTKEGWERVNPKPKAKAKAKAKGKGKGKSGNKKICKYFAAGNCRNGNQCDDLRTKPVAAIEEAPAKTKGKGKSKQEKPTPKEQESGN